MYRASYCSVLMTNEMHNSYNQFYSTNFCLFCTTVPIVLCNAVYYAVLLIMYD